MPLVFRYTWTLDHPVFRPSCEPSVFNRWSGRRLIVTGLCLVLLAGAAALWWRTTHIDRHGHLPKPAMALCVPGGFLQGTGMRDGLHCICMRDHLSRTVSIQFERATYLGNAGYHGATVVQFGGFTGAILTKTYNETDYILSPYAALVLPYWFLVATFGCAFLLVSGIARLVLACSFGRWFRSDHGKPLKAAAKVTK